MDEEQHNEGIGTQNGSSVPSNQGGRQAHTSAPKMRNAFQVMMNQRNAKAKMHAKDSQAMDTEVDTNNEKVGNDDIIMGEEPFSTVAAKRAPTVDLTQLPHRVLLYVVFVVAKGGSRSTGDKIRS